MQKLFDLNYLIFDTNNLDGTGCKIAILHSELNKDSFNKYYVDEHLHSVKNKLIAFNLFKSKKNTKSELQKDCLNEIYYYLDKINITHIICADAEYFKTLTGIQSAEKNLYTIVDSKCKKYKVIYCPSYKTIFYDPDNIKTKIKLSLDTFVDFYNGNTYYIPGSNIIKDYTVLSDPIEIQDFFNQVIDNNIDLTSDIETFSLKHYDAGLYTITFCWDQHSGVSIPIDNIDKTENTVVRKLLKDFFINNGNKLIWHNASFDLTVLIYQLFMDNHSDTEGLLYGLEVMLNNFEDTKLIAYLALNSTAKYSLSLKSLAYEYSGNYAIEEINDVTKLNISDVLKYNFIDGISTWYVYNKYYPIMVQDQQEDVYVNIFKQSLKDIIQMQLTGLPLDMDKTIKAFDKIKLIEQDALNNMMLSVLVQDYEFCFKQDWVLKKNNTLVKKKVTIQDCKLEFNPNSSIQVKELLYSQNFMDLPVLDLTTTKQPATGKKTLEKLIHYTDDPLKLDFINSLIRYKDVNKLVTSFFPAFMRAYKAFDNHHYLFGNFNLGGTKSGRLSSNKINLQNLPSTGTDYAKVVKECFVAPKGYLFIGVDFNGLEDRISALQTKDPVKLSVFIDGFDGHCLNSYFYYKEQMPDINPKEVKSINSIKTLYPKLRQSSKNVTFACTYQGTYYTLHKNLGLPIPQAKEIENRYKNLYYHSISWVTDKLVIAANTGYVELAFGLRLRTPLLKQVVMNNSRTPILASAEGRTAGNALGQSYGLLNSRASIEFMKGVRESEFRLDIKPVAQIHDAMYFLIKEDINVIKYVNDNLIKAMEWQDDPKIYHDKVKLGAELSIFYPDWSKELNIKNKATIEEIEQTIQDYVNQLDKGK